MISLVSHNADLDKINNLIIEPPDHWNGIHHCDLIEKITTELLKYDRRVSEFRGHLFYNNLDLYGTLMVPVPGIKTAKVTPCLGFLNSGSQKQTLTFYCGYVDNDTDAAIIFAKFSCGRRISSLDTDSDIVQAVKWWTNESRCLPNLLSRVTDKQFDRILLKMARDRITSWSKIGRLNYQWNACPKKTMWDLFISFGRVVASDPGSQQILRLYRFYNLVQLETKHKEKEHAR